MSHFLPSTLPSRSKNRMWRTQALCSRGSLWEKPEEPLADFEVLATMSGFSRDLVRPSRMLQEVMS